MKPNEDAMKINVVNSFVIFIENSNVCAIQKCQCCTSQVYIYAKELREGSRYIEILKNVAEQNLKMYQGQLFKTKFTYANVSSKTQFYTGITNDIFKMIVSSVKTWPSKSLLSLEDSLLITLMRVRLACPSKDFAL